MNSIDDFKKEIQGLEFKKAKYERALIIAQSNYETAVKTLQEKYNIDEDQLNDLIETKKNMLLQAEEKVQANITKLSNYVDEIGKVVNGL